MHQQYKLKAEAQHSTALHAAGATPMPEFLPQTADVTPLVAATAGPDPYLAIRLHRAAKAMRLGEQFGVGTDSVGTDEIDKSDESAPSAPSAPFETTNCGKMDANCGKIDAEETEERGDTTGVNTPFHLEQKNQKRIGQTVLRESRG